MSDQAIVDKLALVWQSITGRVCHPHCTAMAYPARTARAGQVQDQVAHLIGGNCACSAAGARRIHRQDVSHVKNDKRATQ